MPLIKVEDGLLEEENFFITSSAADFLGDGEWSRTNDAFTLKTGCVKRRLPYKNFVIDVFKNSSNGDFQFFIENDGNKMGIMEEDAGEEIIGWRITYFDGFIQAYCTTDGVLWTNTGGGYVALGHEVLQGFMVKGEGELILTRYIVYSSPFVTLQNFPPQSAAKLYDTNGDFIEERLFDNSHQCEIFVSNPGIGRFEVLNDDNLLFTSPLIEFKPGDIFLFSIENIQLIYDGRVLDYRAAELGSYNEKFAVKNAGDSDASNILIEVLNDNKDLIELSFDNINYLQKLNVEMLAVGEEKEFYLKITREGERRGFYVADFDIQIYQGTGGSL